MNLQEQAKAWCDANRVEITEAELKRCVAKLREMSESEAEVTNAAGEKLVERITRLGEALGVRVESYFEEAEEAAAASEASSS